MSSRKQDLALPPSYGSLPPIQTSAIRICSISLTGRDKIRLIGTPPPLTPLLRSSILSTWGTIRRESNYAGSHEFRLSGTPWHGQGPDSVRSRRLLNGILYTMAKASWDLVQATDVSLRERDKDTLFFEYSEPSSSAAAGSAGHSAMSSSVSGSSSRQVSGDGYGSDGLREVDLFAVSFNRSDRIRVVSQQPPQVAFQMMELIKQAVASQWRYGIQAEQDYCGAAEIKLQGNPFKARRSESVHARMMLAQMIANFKAEGYKLYASLSIGEGKDGNDVESWVFRRMNASWQ